MNPIEEFLLVKTALKAPRQAGMFGQIGNFMAQGLGAGLGAAVLTGGALAVRNIYNAATAKKDFKEMLQWNQDLHGADQRLLNQSFRSLRTFAPDMAKDPLVAGSMVRRMVEAPQGVAGIMGEAIQGQRGLPAPLMESFTEGAQAGVGRGVGTFQPFGLPPSTVPWTKAQELMAAKDRTEAKGETKLHRQKKDTTTQVHRQKMLDAARQRRESEHQDRERMDLMRQIREARQRP
jgi:hypothetical protein